VGIPTKEEEEEDGSCEFSKVMTST